MKTLFKVVFLLIFTYFFIVILFGFLTNNIQTIGNIMVYLKEHLLKISDLILTLLNNTLSPEINHFIRELISLLSK